jgi:hypothetical protein
VLRIGSNNLGGYPGTMLAVWGISRQRLLVIFSLAPETHDLVEPSLAATPNVCWTRRRLGVNTVGYVVYEFSRC